MGKTQSKRSVDITTEPKKDGLVEEGTGKMEKIEDVDQLKPQVNGDTHHNETESTDKEKPDNETTENEKDLSTEKEQKAVVAADSGASGDTAVATSASTDDNETLDESKVSAGASGADAASASAADTSTVSENGESSKKPKKEKVKKKWSFRSISFGKKDKQKPSKKEEAKDAAAAAATNGECEKVPEEPTEEQTTNETVQSAAAEDKPSNDDNATAKPSVVEEPKAEKSDEILNGDSKVADDVAGGTVVATAASVVAAAGSVAATTASVVAAAGSVVAAAATETVDVEAEKISEETVTAAAKAVVAAVVSQTETVVGSVDAVTTNGTTKIESAVENLADETSVKLNGSSESPKIEVKSEDIIKNTTTSDDQIIAQNQETIISGDSESIAQNPSPPPLPCTLPPSQVMVFALSDDSNQVESIKKEIIIESPILVSDIPTTVTASTTTTPVVENVENITSSSVLEEPIPIDSDISLVGSVAKDLVTDIENDISVAIDTVANSFSTIAGIVVDGDNLSDTQSNNIILESQAKEITIELASSNISVNEVQITPSTPDIPTTEITPATPDALPSNTSIAESAIDLQIVPESVEANETPIASEPIIEKDAEIVGNDDIDSQSVQELSEIAENVAVVADDENVVMEEALSEIISTVDDNNTSCNSPLTPTPSTAEENQISIATSIENISNQETPTTTIIQPLSSPQNPISPPQQEQTQEEEEEEEEKQQEQEQQQIEELPSSIAVDDVEIKDISVSLDQVQTNGDIVVDEEQIVSEEEIAANSNEIPIEITTDGIETNDEENIKSIANDVDVDVSDDLPPPPPSPVKDIADNEIVEDITSSIDAIETPSSTATSSSAKTPIAIDEAKIFQETELLSTSTSTTSIPTSTTSKQPTKENGVGDKHETSATESLNGGVEHKTIEELKSENKIAPEVTNESAVAVAE